MEKELVVSLLIIEYKKIYPEDNIPENFNLLKLDDKINLLKKALKNKIKIKDLL